MSTLGSLSKVSPDASLQELIDHVALLTRTVEYQLGGNLNTQNIREIAGWYVDNTMFVSKDMNVGLSSAKDQTENIRIFAGNAALDNAPFRVYDTGKLIATDAYISGNITMTSGSIEWTGISAPDYTQINGTKPPSDADNTDQNLGTALGTYYTKIGATYVYTGTLVADQINAVSGIVLGSNATIDWSSVAAPDYTQIAGTKPPSDADNTYSTIGASRLTHIDATGVYTGTVTASQVNTVGLAAEKIYQPSYSNNYVQLGGSYGDMILHYDGTEYFKIYNGIDFADLVHYGQSRLRFASATNAAAPLGTWDFSGASVTGLSVTGKFG